jgi:hypothetical protein
MLQNCSEDYGNGERIGVITRFAQKGLIWKSWEANLNVTQTGMNTSGDPFMFSIDNNKENKALVALIDSAANKGWKVKVMYHECLHKNMTLSRGETDYFVDDLKILDRKFTEKLQFSNTDKQSKTNGRAVDTVYVVIDKSKLKH